METTDSSWWAWGFATVVGPILLAIGLAYGVWKTKPWKRGPKVQGPIPPEQRTVNAASWGAEDKPYTRPQPDTDPVGAREATKRQVHTPERQQQGERESVIQLDDRSQS
jgi:hypothetical protein